MARMKIGTCPRAYGLPLRVSLARTQKLKVPGIELECVGELSPSQLSQTGRRELRHLLRSHNIEMSSLFCPLRFGLDTPENQEARLDHIKAAMAMSFDLGARLTVIQAGRVPAKDDEPRAPFFKDALETLGKHGDRIGSVLALETGLEAGQELAQYLQRFDSGSLAVCFNPGALLTGGFDPYQSARDLARRVALVHASDARLVSPTRGARPVPLGTGDLDWLQLAGVMEEIDCHGWITLAADNVGPGEVERSVEFLRATIAR